MNCGKVIGKAYSKFCHPSLTGIDIKIIQAINPENRKAIGKPFFAVDPLGVGLGEIVGYEESFQAIWAFKDHMIPVDSAITAIIDNLYSSNLKGDRDDNR